MAQGAFLCWGWEVVWVEGSIRSMRWLVLDGYEETVGHVVLMDAIFVGLCESKARSRV
jgi:hypothetical protein